MVDYNAALPQLQQYQAPNMLAIAAQANQMQLHQAQLAEVQRTANEQNQLRQMAASGVDLFSPEGINQVARFSPALASTYAKEADARKTAGLNQELLRAQVGQIPLQNEKALGEVNAQKQTAMAADHKLYSEMLNKVLALPDDQAKTAYEMLRAGAVSKYKDLDTAWPATFDRNVLEKQMLTAEQTAQARAAEKLANQPTVTTTPGMPPMIVNKGTGTFRMAQEAPSGAAPAVAGVAPVTAAPAAVMQQPAAAPAIGDAFSQRLNAAEGVDKNSRSTAQGFGQFLNGTFVDTAKKVFPELANKSPAEILTLRGTKLADGTPIEAALEQKFRTDNIASLASAGIQPTPGNVYLAHFLGAGGARNVLSADPNTPLSQVVSADAIKANPEVLALRNKTVGDLQNWANSKFSGQPGLAASMTAGNARLGGAPTGFVPAGGAPMSPGAPTVNNALMANMFGAAPPQNAMLAPPQQTPLSINPSIGGGAPAVAPATQAPAAPTTFAEAEAQRQARVAAQAGATTTATKTAENQAKAADALPKLEENIRTVNSALDQMIGKTTVDAEGRVVEDPNAPLHPGFAAAVGFSPSKWISKEPIQGTDRADFEQLYKQVQGGAFLDAYNTLRGGGSITEKEGEKATAAKNAMSLATSEKAFIKAANEYRGALTRGLELMRQQAAGDAAPAGRAAPAAATYTEGQTATGPNGAKVIFRNGHWTPQ